MCAYNISLACDGCIFENECSYADQNPQNNYNCKGTFGTDWLDIFADLDDEELDDWDEWKLIIHKH
jgi:hypothetical protein